VFPFPSVLLLKVCEMDDTQRKWISRPDMAKRFGVTPRSVFTWEKNPPPGYPLPVDIRGYKYYPLDEVIAYERMLIASRVREIA
jgi:hypothetical protein